MGLAVVRLSASWRNIATVGYRDLDWLLTCAAEARQRVVLTVGMKALGWPEFYVPEGLNPSDGSVRRRALQHVAGGVRRYRDNRALVAWQIENEPVNRLWVTEAQAEPWEARPREVPLTVQPEDVVTLVSGLAAVGIEAVLLWGSEYWLWRQDHGDPRWVEAVALGLTALA